jgi:hypothetical protein
MATEDDDELSMAEKYQIAKRDPKNRDKDKKAPKGSKPDKDKGPKKDPKNKPDIPVTRRLVRNPDGTIGVQFVNPRTGEEVGKPFGRNRDLITAGGFGDVFDNKGGGKKKKTSTEQLSTSEPPKDEPWHDPWDHGHNRGPVGTGQRPTAQTSGTPSQAAKDNQKAKAASESDQEQGDFDDGSFIDGNAPTTPGIGSDPDYGNDFGLYDPATGRGVYGRQAVIDGTAAAAKEDAQYSSLDGPGFGTIDGTNPHPMEGQNLNDVVSSAAARNNWSPEDKELAARTLAGEIDQRQTDLSTPEGIAEANAIMSTMENRDLANGPHKSLSDAINAKDAYSTWNGPKEADVANTNYSANPDKFNDIVDNYAADPNSNLGFTNYYNDKLVSPSWGANLEEAQNIGAHRFGIDPSIAGKIPGGQPITEAQKDQIATDITNQNFNQSFAAPVSKDLAATAPTIDTTGVTTDDMASGIAAQRDYNGPIGPATPTDRIVESGPFGSPSVPAFSSPQVTDTVASINNQVATENAYGITQGQQIASTPPTIDAPSQQVASRNVDIAAATDVEDGFSTAPDEGSVQDRIGTGPAAQTADEGRLPGVTVSSAGVYGDPTQGYSTPSQDAMSMGFGDYVNTTEANTIDSAQAATQEARINGAYENNNVGMIDAANAIASSPPSVADTANAVDAATPDAASAGMGADTSSGIDSGGELGGPGMGGADGGFADSPDTGGESSAGGTSGGESPDGEGEMGGSDGFL